MYFKKGKEATDKDKEHINNVSVQKKWKTISSHKGVSALSKGSCEILSQDVRTGTPPPTGVERTG